MWSSRTAALAIPGLFLLAACDRNADDLLPQNMSDTPPVVEAGPMQVLNATQYQEYLAAPDKAAWCDETNADGERRCLYARVGSPDLGKKGGGTYTFKGTGGDVCLVVDPETVFWNQAVAAEDAELDYLYPDYTGDDGDIDMFAGLTSYYTGSPGIELGDFKGFYTDSLGRQITIEYDECSQNGSSVSGITNAHAGRATQEYCTIDTDQLNGIQYTVLLETFSVPLDDGELSFAAMAIEGACSSFSVNECTLIGESIAPDGSLNDCSDRLEYASCQGEFDRVEEPDATWRGRGLAPLSGFCCANPEMCGDDSDLTLCTAFDRDAWCSDYPDLCCVD